MTAVLDGPSTSLRGGNRLPEGHPARGRPPAYERKRSLGPDTERRDRRQRERARRAAAMARERGELPGLLYTALSSLLDMSDDLCSPVWPALATIGRKCGGLDERTAGRHMAALKDLGWLDFVHRYRFRNGHIEGDTNLWRVDIPARYREVLEGREDAARARSAQKGRATPKAPQNRPGGRSPANRRPGTPTPASPRRGGEPARVGDGLAAAEQLADGDSAAGAVVDASTGEIAPSAPASCSCGEGPFTHPCGRSRYVCRCGHAKLCPCYSAQAPP